MGSVGLARRPVIDPTLPWFDLSSHARNPMSWSIVPYGLTEALLSHITQTPALEQGSRSVFAPAHVPSHSHASAKPSLGICSLL